jgi:putative nucleotidyltransferase with HDIG domain
VKKRILFVDDEPRVLEGLEDLLVRYRRKWEMVFAPGGAAALQHMRQRPFDVIITDMRMPEMDGATLLRFVADERPETIRIVLSGCSETEAAIRTVPVAHQFLPKPCDAAVLESVVERACALHVLVPDETMRKIIGGLKHLPALPENYQALQGAVAGEPSGTAEAGRIIERDIAMSAKVLQLVNSAFFGLGRPIIAAAEAVHYLGTRTIQQLAVADDVFAGNEVDPRSGFSLAELHNHSRLTAEIARSIMAGDRKQSEEARMAGFLHDIGKLIMAVELSEQLAEQEPHGITHAEIGAYLLGAWGLPYPVVEAVANHHSPERVPKPAFNTLAAVHVADALAHECEPESKRGSLTELNMDYLTSLNVAGQLPRWREIAQELTASPARAVPAGERL